MPSPEMPEKAERDKRPSPDKDDWLYKLDPPESAADRLKKETDEILTKFPQVQKALKNSLKPEEFSALRLSFTESLIVRETNPPQYSGSLGLSFKRGKEKLELEESFSWYGANGRTDGTFRGVFEQALMKLIDRVAKNEFKKEPKINFEDETSPPKKQAPEIQRKLPLAKDAPVGQKRRAQNGEIFVKRGEMWQSLQDTGFVFNDYIDQVGVEIVTVTKAPEKIQFNNKLKEEHMKLLREYRALSEDELLKKLTPAFIFQHHKDGTLYILLLAIDATDKRNTEAELQYDPESHYSKMIDQFVNDGMQFRNKIMEAKGLSIGGIRKKVQLPPYSGYLKQEGLPGINLRYDQMNENQVRAFYEFCLLEEQVRGACIRYGCPSFYGTLGRTDHGARSGDCNAVANYYASLVSFSGSELLQEAVRYVTMNGHAQICLDLGKDQGGKVMQISKNTSYVDMSQLDSSGRQRDTLPYQHNFYDFQHDIDSQGLTRKNNTHGVVMLAITELEEVQPHGAFVDMSDEQLLRMIKLCNKIFEIHPYHATANDNFISATQELLKRKKIGATEAMRSVVPVLKNYIDASYWSGFDLFNFVKEFGEQAAQPLIVLYENKIKRDEKAFVKFLRSSEVEMRKNKNFDRRIQSGSNTLSIDLENKYRMLELLWNITNDRRVKFICNEQRGLLAKEMRYWK